MANAIKWDTAATSRSTVLTTGLNSLADNAYSAAGAEIDNSANLDQYGMVEIVLASLNPTAGAFLTLFMLPAPDGTTYPDVPIATNVSCQLICAQVSVEDATTGAKSIMSAPFKLPPCKVKFVLRNDANVAFGASGNTVELFTWNDEVQ